MMRSASSTTATTTRSMLLLCFLVTCCLVSSASAASSQRLRGTTTTTTTTGTVSSYYKNPPPLVKGQRKDRFPSVEDRVRLYAGNWYAPPCSPVVDTFPVEHLPSAHPFEEQVQITNWTFTNYITADQIFWFTPTIAELCDADDETVASMDPAWVGRIDPRHEKNMRMYCQDVLEWRELTLHVRFDTEIPLLAQFGDMKHSHIYRFLSLPHFKKFRSATSEQNQLAALTTQLECQTAANRPYLPTPHTNTLMQPMIWKLATSRHFKFLKDVITSDTPWEYKKPAAIWRGQLTGSRDGFNATLTDYENCQNLVRCKLVYDSDSSPLVDAKLTTTRKRMNNTVNGVELVVTKQPVEHLMTYKGIIMLEGNDVASGLKWALLSQSVVLMPIPKHTSWAMEEWLVPWKHYIPIEQDDLSDVYEKMEWINTHDEEAYRISQHATLWMEDLCYHPDAAKEDVLIKEELLRRYAQHFRVTRSMADVRAAEQQQQQQQAQGKLQPSESAVRQAQGDGGVPVKSSSSSSAATAKKAAPILIDNIDEIDDKATNKRTYNDDDDTDQQIHINSNAVAMEEAKSIGKVAMLKAAQVEKEVEAVILKDQLQRKRDEKEKNDNNNKEKQAPPKRTRRKTRN